MKTLLRFVVILGLAAVVAGCASLGRGKGPLDSFALPAAANPSLSGDVSGLIFEGADPKEIQLTVPAGTDLHNLVARLSLNKEAVITVISSGTRVVQQNGATPNDFSAPVTYAIEVSGDKKPWTYRVVVRLTETNPALARLEVPAGVILQPAFDPGLRSYTVQVPFAATSVQVRALGQSAHLKSITVDGVVVAGASALATVQFPSGQEKSFTVDTLAEDGVTQARYTVTFVRAPPDSNALLASLDLGKQQFVPVFSAAGNSYQALVPFSTKQLTIHARPQSPVASVSLAAAETAQGVVALRSSGDPAGRAGAVVDLPPVNDVPIIVLVTAQDGSIQQYLVDVRRAPPDRNTDLASLTASAGALSPVFSPRTDGYSLMLPPAAESVTVTAIAASPVSTVSVAQQQQASYSPGGSVTVSVAPGSFVTLAFLVTAENGSQRAYHVQVSRPADSNALLRALRVSGAQVAPAFNPGIAVYDVVIPAGSSSFTVAASPQSRYASVSVDGRPAIPTGLTVAVAPGTTRIVLIDVRAQNGAIVRYTLRVTVAPPAPVATAPAPPAPAPVPAARAPAPALPAPTPAAPAPAAPAPVPAAPAPAPAAPAPVPAAPAPAPAAPAPAPAAPPAAAPALAMPADTGADRIVVSAKNLKLGARELAALASAHDEVGSTARITVRIYRTETVITQYAAAVEVRGGPNLMVNVSARSNGVSLPKDRMIEVETAIPTKAGKYLFYTEAQPADREVRVDVPFFLYGNSPRAGWPAVGSMVPVSGLLSTLPAGKERAADKEDFPRNAKGALSVTVELSDARSGAVYGSASVDETTGPARGRLLQLSKPIPVPEGATVKYTLSVKAKNGKVWTAAGTADAWTTALVYPAGFRSVVLEVSDDLAPAGGPEPPQGAGAPGQQKKN